ncbi:hypothetical protein [Luteolibacter luteus]|uniref:Uncharacterized protein n=1 Tax=Luteolibacter luteus TaxID=2728835 RepID=A0A858RFA5_9BACT|nr:hypothetical protein [Luteolibacter luteus]QJE94980.1 hypothetical protein HHL09_04030 [Luteolibacter luteus]
MIFSRTIPLFLSALAPLTAASFPVVPPSAQVLTSADVKGFWLQRLERQRQRECDLLAEIAEGRHDLAAELVCLSHNVKAFERQGNEEMARETAEKLLKLRQEVAEREIA